LGGAANYIKELVEREIRVKARFAIPSTMQRNGVHFASATDAREAYEAGRQAVRCALSGVSGKMVTFVRIADDPYRMGFDLVDLDLVANGEKYFPLEWVSEDGFFVTEDFIRYARPLIQGEVSPPIKDGIPYYTRLKKYFLPV